MTHFKTLQFIQFETYSIRSFSLHYDEYLEHQMKLLKHIIAISYIFNNTSPIQSNLTNSNQAVNYMIWNKSLNNMITWSSHYSCTTHINFIQVRTWSDHAIEMVICQSTYWSIIQSIKPYKHFKLFYLSPLKSLIDLHETFRMVVVNYITCCFINDVIQFSDHICDDRVLKVRLTTCDMLSDIIALHNGTILFMIQLNHSAH